jgi:hexosaminidase
MTDSNNKIISSWMWQEFLLNKATGKKVTLTTMPNRSYSGSGAFTLVDGVQNTVGMSKSAQFLGFLGTDLEAVIDLDSVQTLSEIILHTFEQTPSWIYRPTSVSMFGSNDGVTYQLLEQNILPTGRKNLEYRIRKPMQSRFIKIVAKNSGVIAPGNPGAGNKSWIFADEIEIH